MLRAGGTPSIDRGLQSLREHPIHDLRIDQIGAECAEVRAVRRPADDVHPQREATLFDAVAKRSARAEEIMPPA